MTPNITTVFVLYDFERLNILAVENTSWQVWL